MSTTVRITYEQFEEMILHGELAQSDDRYELLFGEVCPMPWPDPPHESVVSKLTAWSVRSLPEDAAEIRTQCTLGIPSLDSMTLPDVAWMKAGSYFERRPTPEDVQLVIGVADPILSKDRNQKARLYAMAGIAEYWLVNDLREALPGRLRRGP